MKKNQKGFTLVELIVVLVILAILAAILVPALLGYIDRARGSQLLLNGKSVLTAAQAEASNCYGIADGTATQSITYFFDTNKATYIKSIAETSDTPVNSGAVFSMKVAPAAATKDNHAAWTVDKVAYVEGGNGVYFNGSSWEEGLTAKEAIDKVTATNKYGFTVTETTGSDGKKSTTIGTAAPTGALGQ